jgi:hypothetical protein
VDGRPNTPLPMTLLMTAAVRAQRPIARMSVGRLAVWAWVTFFD